MKQKNLRQFANPDLIELEKNFILIMKPKEMINNESSNRKNESHKHARYMIDQLFDEIEQIDLLDYEKLRDIKFLLDDYFENYYSGSNTDFTERNPIITINSDPDDPWDTPYDDDNQISIYY
jgi:hypothetical protein